VVRVHEAKLPCAMHESDGRICMCAQLLPSCLYLGETDSFNIYIRATAVVLEDAGILSAT
jgi:hypothetical protein